MSAPQSVNPKTLREFDDAVSGSALAVAHFWAPWCEPCALLDRVLDQLAHDAPSVRLIRVEAEEAPEVSERHGVTVVPLFKFFARGAEVDSLEGADPAALSSKFVALAAGAPAASASGAVPAGNQPPPQQQPQPLAERLRALLSQRPVMLFMKGSPDEPRCGFSRQVVDALRGAGCSDFGSFDILSDEAVRQGLKEFSNWPTYPQLYINGELVGGCDIVLELAETGELKRELSKASQSPADQLRRRIEALVSERPVMLFMKGCTAGTPVEPRCGFSRKVVDALRAAGQADFGSFDILSDDAVRQGLKEFSNWPTYPQLYVNGELVGGCDIVLELAETGELQDTIEEMKART